MQLKVWAQTDKGLKRENNQDTFLIDEQLKLFVVADGMGGHRGGEVASALAVETVQEVVTEGSHLVTKMNPRDLLMKAYLRASERIYSRSFENENELRGMGTTMVMIFVDGNHLFIGNVGDSRCYLYHAPDLWQLTEDHSLVGEQIRSGLISEEQIGQLLPKNVITRSVGYEREVIPDFYERKLHSGETFLMCSDGLSGMVADERIRQILAENAPQDVPEKCIQEAKANGGDDNITVMVVQVSS